MSYLADCYVLVNNRSKEQINDFLDVFVPNREETSSEYEVPQYGNETIHIFASTDLLIDHLVTNTNEPYSIYWKSVDDGDIRYGMCFFTNDAQLVLGLSIRTNGKDASIQDEAFELMKKFSGSSEGYITYEETAPFNSAEFMEIVRSRNES